MGSDLINGAKTKKENLPGWVTDFSPLSLPVCLQAGFLDPLERGAGSQETQTRRQATGVPRVVRSQLLPTLPLPSILRREGEAIAV